MKRPLTDEDLTERAAIDGRVVFATAAFAIATALVALLDRVGAPPRLVAILGPAVALVGLASVGFLLRTMRVSRFYSAGRSVPAAYAGFAFASLAAGLVTPFLPPVAGGPSFRVLLGGFAGGLALAALAGGPLLRKTGAFSIPDLIAGRFPNLALRLGVVAVIAGVGFLIGVAGFAGAVAGLSRATGLGVGASLWLGGIVLFFIVAPGGVAGLVWAAAGAAGMTMAGLALPLLVLYTRGVGLPLPAFGDVAAWSASLSRMAEWNLRAGDIQPTGWGAILAVVLGVGALAPLLTPAMATRDTSAARGAGAAGLFWCLIFAGLAAATLALSTLALDAATVGARPEALPAPVIEASRAGLIEICGGHPATPAAARAACAARSGFSGALSGADVVANGRFLLLGLPALRGLGEALAGLAASGVIALALVLAAAGFQTCATALGHDAFYRVREATAMTSRRLAVTRAILAVAIIAAGLLLAGRQPDPRALVGLAIVLCVATVTPLLALSVWPRAEGVDAAAALLAGLASAEAMIWWRGGLESLDGVGAAAITACVVSMLTGFAASFLHPADPMSLGGAFAHGLLRGRGDLINPDKGA